MAHTNSLSSGRGLFLAGSFWAFMILLFLSGCSQIVRGATGESEAKRFHVLLILIDDLGWRDLGCYGSSFYETPNIDRLASEGMLFTNAYSACVVCSPSRGSLMTGRSTARVGLTGHINPTGSHRYPRRGAIIPPDDFAFLPTEETTIAEMLKTQGYSSLFFGKWHLGGDEKYWPVHQGFDTTIGLMPGGSRNAPLHHYTYFYPYFNRSRSPEFQIPGLKGGEPGEYLTDRLTDETITWLKSHDFKKPLFIYLSHYAVHTPLEGPPALVEKYQKKLKTDSSQKSASYAAMIENTDTNLGRVLETLERLGVAEETIVIFTSDNGGTTQATRNDPLREGKGYLYEGGIRVPLIVKWPARIAPGTQSAVPVITHDIYPTILDMLGIPLPSDLTLDGKSLVPILTGKGSFPPRALYWYYPHYSPQAKNPGAAIRSGKYKLIEHYDPPGLELFDLDNDLGERNDLSTELPEKVQELKRDLHSLLQSANTRMHRANPNYRGK